MKGKTFHSYNQSDEAERLKYQTTGAIQGHDKTTLAYMNKTGQIEKHRNNSDFTKQPFNKTNLKFTHKTSNDDLMVINENSKSEKTTKQVIDGQLVAGSGSGSPELPKLKIKSNFEAY